MMGFVTTKCLHCGHVYQGWITPDHINKIPCPKCGRKEMPENLDPVDYGMRMLNEMVRKKRSGE